MNEPVDDLLPFGVLASTGKPLPNLTDEAIIALLEREREPAPEASAQRARADVAARAFAVSDDIDDPNDLSQTGWGVVYGPGIDPAIKEALQPLIEHRRNQAASPFKIYDEGGYIPGESIFDWLKRRNVRLDTVNPRRGVPFYLMIVAPPETIPFEFQYVLDLHWGTGRLWFPTVEEFRQYAHSVVRYETALSVQTTRQIAIFAPRHDFDTATQLFTRQVALPMHDGDGELFSPIGQAKQFKLAPYLGEAATKGNLTKILAPGIPAGRPALLFSGGHGMAFDLGDARQLECQGALVCQEWEGFGKITPDHWFSAADVPANAQVHGLVHFMFACYGGGVPKEDNFERLNNAARQIAPRPFISRLPQTLLAHPNGGALAVLAHVERAWAYSFQADGGGAPQIDGFREVINRLTRGARLGYATDTFNLRWAGLSTELSEMQLRHDPSISNRALGRLWVARDDARNFVILGDPATRLRIESMPPLD